MTEMIRHRFINEGRSPIPMGGTAEYACICGKRGTYEVIERHIATNSVRDEITREAAPTAPYGQVIDGDDFGGDTMANYLPHEPRKPAHTGEALPLERPDRPATPEPLPPPPSTSTSAASIDKPPRSIAESFQDMLRSAFQAGTAATATGESFETWYQREVLQ